MKKCAGPEAFDKEVEKKMKKMQTEQEGGIHIDINSHKGEGDEELSEKKLAKTVYNGTKFDIVKDGDTYLVKVGKGSVGGRFKSEKDAMTYGTSWLADQKKRGLLAAEDKDEKKLSIDQDMRQAYDAVDECATKLSNARVAANKAIRYLKALGEKEQAADMEKVVSIISEALRLSTP